MVIFRVRQGEVNNFVQGLQEDLSEISLYTHTHSSLKVIRVYSHFLKNSYGSDILDPLRL